MQVGGTAIDATGPGYDTPARFGFVYDTTNATVYLNNSGGTPTAASYTQNTNHLFAIGARFGNTGSDWAGKVAEIVLYNRALDSTERTNLDNYFKAKWGL